MRNLYLKITVLALAVFLTAGSTLTAAEKLKADGYDVRLSASNIELVFPDGSVLTTPQNFDGKDLDMLSATEGMARDLLDEAYRQLGLEKTASLPKAFALSQNSPNPFNPSTTISYSIPDNSQELAVKLSVYNIRGQLVRILVDDSQGPGTYNINWDGDSNDCTCIGGTWLNGQCCGDDGNADDYENAGTGNSCCIDGTVVTHGNSKDGLTCTDGQIIGSKSGCDVGQYVSGISSDGTIACANDPAAISLLDAGDDMTASGTTERTLALGTDERERN